MKKTTEKPNEKTAVRKVKVEKEAPSLRSKAIALITPSNVIALLFFAFLIFLSFQIANTKKAVTEYTNLNASEQDMVPLNTQAPYKATPTNVIADPNKTPVNINYEEFIYTGFEIRFRGGSPTSACPYRWVSVRNKPSISGDVIACLPPYSNWNIEVRVQNVDALVYEGNNVWGLLSMQKDKWIALKYGDTYFTNWRGIQ
jgi:hypothetical protein